MIWGVKKKKKKTIGPTQTEVECIKYILVSTPSPFAAGEFHIPGETKVFCKWV